jgi:signal peptidase I
MVGDLKPGLTGASHVEGDRHAYDRIARDLTWESSEIDRKIRLEVISRSMFPMLKPGDIVVVERAPSESLRIGDLVVSRRRGEFITHRLVARGAESWITKGDAQRHLDPPASRDAIFGKVVAIEHKGAQINLQTSYWKLANLGLGYLHRSQGLLFGFLRAWKSRLKGKLIKGGR